MESASSTTRFESPPRIPYDPSEWTIDDVIQHVMFVEPSLNHIVDLFRKHEIDGRALLLLPLEMMMKYMGLKLGPALKLWDLVNRIKIERNKPLD